MPSLIKLIGTRGSSFEVTEDSYGNISHPKTIYSTVAPTLSDTHPAGTRWLDSVTGTEYRSVGGGAWRRDSEIPAKILPQADIDARPKRLWPYDSLPVRLFKSDGQYAYGHDSSPRQLVRVDVHTLATSNGYQWPSGYSIADIYIGRGSIFASVVETATNKYTLYRSTDRGESFTAVHELNNLDGTHYAHGRLLQHGLSAGRILGQDALVLALYNVLEVAGGTTPGGPGDTIYIAVSLDDGATWEVKNIWNQGTRKIRHFHAVRYDHYRDQWIFLAGDADSQSAVIVWDGVSDLAVGNLAPSEMAGLPGFTVGYGSQRWRAVDVMITQSHLYTHTDTVDDVEGGIWRMNPDLSKHRRVDHSIRGKLHEGWSSVIASDGTLLWCDDCRSDSTERYISIYGSATGARWFEIGRFQVYDAGVKLPRGFFEAGGRIWFSFDSEAGKGTYNTTVFDLTGKFREERPDNLGPVYYVDFASGSDAANGYGRSTAWKTARNALSANKITSGARVILSAGTSTEDGVATISYGSNARPATMDARVVFSGAGRDSTTINLSGATAGWRDSSNAKTWKIELESLTLTDAAGTNNILWSGSAHTTPPTWYTRDARIGQSSGSNRCVYLRSGTLYGYRTEITQASDAGKYTVSADGGTVFLEACLLYGGRALHTNGGKISALHCEFSGYASTGLLVSTTATIKPVVKNCVFTESAQLPMDNDSGTITLTASDVSGCYYVKDADASVPAALLAVSGPLDRDPDTLVPDATSTLVGVATAAGVAWDYYGKPFRSNPAVGAVEVEDL